MIANITFKAYEKQDFNYKDESALIVEFTLPVCDIDKIDKICNAIESAYEFGNPISWSINIDHEYI